MPYAELHCLSNFSFLRGASHPQELVARAAELGYAAIAITDECSLAGVVRAHVTAREHGIQLIIGSELHLEEGLHLVALAPSRAAYGELSGLISLARRRSPKGQYRVSLRDVMFYLKRCLLIWRPAADTDGNRAYGQQLRRLFANRLWLGVAHLHHNNEIAHYQALLTLAETLDIPMLACGAVEMHEPARKPLHDVLAAIRHRCSVEQLGTRRAQNSQQHLRPLARLRQLYPPELLQATLAVAARCAFSLDELRYEYPEEVVPAGLTPTQHLLNLVTEGAARRWPHGTPPAIQQRIEDELALITELSYEYYFLTVHDIVAFARGRNILCQGRGSAANSVVCYCLHITEVSPEEVSLLFERFISRERDEPPDIDVDFEHQRREEVIQYIYAKYTRRRAALAATLITYRSRSAIRDVGGALGLDPILIDDLAKSMAWWDKRADLVERFNERGISDHGRLAQLFHERVQEILGFPRHLSQHVGGFVISRGPISNLVPVENASMPERTVIQWDKYDIEALGLLKVDILALGMLSAIRRSLELVHHYDPRIRGLSDIPRDDTATYRMLQEADSVGVFQIESRAQMSMLPRLRPRCYYDLVIQIAIVRPGPIQGDMVHPYLRRRQGLESATYPSPQIQGVLERTLGVPIFQEQVIQLAMVAAGFTGGEADQLRRAITNWGKNSKLLLFEQRLVQGMLARGYSEDFAGRLFEQIKGFGGYGFPESHSASFALLAYVSAWLKRHHPAAFYVGLLNSQPMGFYSPSQLMQDAARHGVHTLDVDINHSDWEHQLLPGSSTIPNTVRLGLCLARGLAREAALRVVEQRPQGPYRNLAELRRRAQLGRGDLEALAAAGALGSLGSHRQQAQWDVMALQPPCPLLPAAVEPTDKTALPVPGVAEEVLADYHSLGLSLRCHPMALLRDRPPFNRCRRHSDLAAHGNRRFVRIAGLVTCRQRPGTASGVLFLTLEDETGNSNVVVWPTVQQRYRQALMQGRILVVKGVLEARDNVIHIIAGELEDHSHALADLAVRSHDFH